MALHIYSKKIIMVFLALLVSVGGWAQQINITGKVISKSDQAPLPGAYILVKGTTTGTITDLEGAFSLKTNADVTLVCSFLGYKKQEIAIGNQTSIQIVLEEDANTLEDVIVVGYGTSKKSDLTSSIVSVKGDAIKNTTNGNFTEALQGKAAGVQIVSGGGAPGAAPTVLIRGISTVSLSTAPLYVVDGVPVGNNVNFLNPNEIASMEVLKDASASAIYGTRASNGVILITTTRGKSGKTNFQVDLTYGLQQFNKPFNVADSKQYATTMNLARANAAGGALPAIISDVNNLNNTDWWGTGIRKYSPQMNFSASMNGGTDKHTYAVSLNYYKQESFYNEGDWQKFTARVNNDFKLSDWAKFSLDLNPRTESWNDTPDWYSDYLQIDPITPIYKPASQLTGNENYYSKFARSLYTYVWNPIAKDARQNKKGGNYALGSNAGLDLTPIKNLVFHTQFGSDLSIARSDNFNPYFIIDLSHESNKINNISRSSNTTINWNWQNTLTYNFSIDKNKGSLMVGTSREANRYNSVTTYGEGLPNDNEIMREPDAATTNYKSGGTETESSLMSYFSRLTYSYDERYLLTATVRRDGSSKFLANNKWATFPSASLAWRFTNENFLKNFNAITDGKLYVGWGEVGNQALPNDVYLSSLYKDYYVFGSGQGSLVNTTAPSTVANPDVKWETVEDKNIGLEFKMFKSSLTASFELYQKTTRDMLFQKNYPYYSGYPNTSIWTNVGSMQSKGIDFSLNYIHKFNKLTFDVSGNISTSAVKMIKLPEGTPVLYSNNQQTKTVVGDEPGYYYGYKTDGLFQNQTEINSHSSQHGTLLQPNARPGDIRFVDTNNDGVLDANDRVKIGSPWAKFTGGFNLNTSYSDTWGSIDFATNFYFSYGNKLVNTLKTSGLYNAVTNNNVLSNLTDIAWHGEGTSNSVPIISSTDYNENFVKFSDYSIEDGSFLRMKNLQIGYSLPSSMTSKLKISKARFYLSGQNLLTLTKFTGIDPEVAGGVLGFGFAAWNYPVLKTYLVGINLAF